MSVYTGLVAAVLGGGTKARCRLLRAVVVAVVIAAATAATLAIGAATSDQPAPERPPASRTTGP